MSSAVILIILPIIFIAVLNFIFIASLSGINKHAYIINCPYPIYEGVATNVTITGLTVSYDIIHNKDINGNTTTTDKDKVGTRFDCTSNSSGSLLGVSTTTRQYGATLFDAIAYGWTGYVSESITKFFEKVNAGTQLVYAYLTAPAQVTGQVFFNYIYVVLIGLVGLGVLLIVRGN